jgi:biotin carboxyl carrier protein
MYQVNVNGKTHRVNVSEGSFHLEDKPKEVAIHPLREGVYQLIVDRKVFIAYAYSEDKKSYRIEIGGRLYETQVQDEYDQLLERLGMDYGESDAPDDLKAPMPGKVLEVMVSTGDAVEKGQPLMVLEAMKMENVIKSAGNGWVRRVAVASGATVEKNEVMLQFTDQQPG